MFNEACFDIMEEETEALAEETDSSMCTCLYQEDNKHSTSNAIWQHFYVLTSP